MTKTTKINPLLSLKTRSKYLLSTSLKSLGVLFISISLLVLTGCLNDDIVLPSFYKEDWKQTDIIIQDRIIEAIHLYDKDTINKLSFNMSVKTFEDSFYAQIKYVSPMTPQFFLEMSTELKLLYNQTRPFSPVKSSEANYLKQTIFRLSRDMLHSMSLSNISFTLKVYYDNLNTKIKHYDFDYQLGIVETIVDTLSIEENTAVALSELKEMRKNLSETGSPFKRKDITIGLRYAFKNVEELIFLIDERLLKIDLLREEVKDSRELFIRNDSSFNLMESLRKVKATAFLSSMDYPHILGYGFVEVMPTETYRVRQYGSISDKVYVFEEFRFRYKRKQEKYVWGSYTLNDSTMIQKINKYVTEIEVFRITKDAYLMGSEVLLKD
jgi:hypothetical protein